MTTLLAILGIYLALGAPFAVAFAWRGAAVVDPAAAHASPGFRILVLPGAAALWPLLLARWFRASRRPA